MAWYQNRFFYIERPFPWLLVLPLLALAGILAWILW